MEVREIAARNMKYVSYLVIGDKNALIDTGISGLGTYIINRASDYVEKIDYLLLTHSHYDHCGSSHFIKEKMPEIEICASEHAAEILQKPSAIEMIKNLCRKEREKANSSPYSIAEEVPFNEAEPNFDGLEVDRVLKEGDGIDLGGLKLKTLHTPGHTRGNMSFYSEGLRTIFCGGVVEAPLTPSFLYDFDEHINSLEKLVELEDRIDAERISFGHYGSMKIGSKENYFQQLINHAEKYRGLISMFLERNDYDIDQTVEDIIELYWKNFLSPRVKEAEEYNTRAQVEEVANQG